MDPRNAVRVMHSRLRLQHLRMVLALATHGTMGGAAGELHLTQPAVTKALHELEGLIGARLFHRTAQGVKPTESCEPVLRLARSVLHDLQSTLDAVAAITQGEAGTIAAGAVPGRPMVLLAQAVMDVTGRASGLQVRVRDGFSAELRAALEAGAIDLALLDAGESFDPEAVEFEMLSQESLTIVCSTGHVLGQGDGYASAVELVRHVWLMPPRNDATRRHLEVAFAAAGIEVPSIAHEAETRGAMIDMLMAGNLLAALPETMARRLERLGVVRLLESPLRIPPVGYGIAQRRIGHSSESIQRLATAIRAARVAEHSAPDRWREAVAIKPA